MGSTPQGCLLGRRRGAGGAPRGPSFTSWSADGPQSVGSTATLHSSMVGVRHPRVTPWSADGPQSVGSTATLHSSTVGVRRPRVASWNAINVRDELAELEEVEVGTPDEVEGIGDQDKLDETNEVADEELNS